MLPFLVIAVFIGSFWPVRSGDFVIDDYVFLAQSRLIEAPLAAFWSSHFYEPIYFRPIGIVIWWLATEAFGLDYARHSMINLGLHVINILLLHALLAQLGVKPMARLVGVAAFALLPFTVAATLWPSNRFDLLAVGFLLGLAIAVLRFLQTGRWPWLLLAALLSITACLGKEIAFPVATTIACLGLAARSISWARRMTVFAVLGFSISLTFLYRHFMLASPYAVGGNNLLGRMASGVRTWFESMPELARAAVIEPTIPAVSVVAWSVVLVVLTLAMIGVLARWRPGRIKARRLEGSLRDEQGPWHAHVLGAVMVVAGITILFQAPLTWNFREMLSADTLGTVTFARFYYLPMAALAAALAIALMRIRYVTTVSLAMVVATMALAIEQRDLAKRFAAWTDEEIRPMAVAAAETVDQVSGETLDRNVTEDQPCVVVLLDTQKDHPWFRMFSDVTVKARASHEPTWQCYVMTETTPWLFISPQDEPLPEVGLSKIAVDSIGTPLEDSMWGGVRYRYRQSPEGPRSLPEARYFAWQDDRFIEVTDEVHGGARTVEFHHW